MSELKDKAEKYLRSLDCKATVLGFSVLAEVIVLSIDKPDMNCEELFYEYTERHLSVGEKMTSESWRTAYKRALYCFNTSDKAAYFESFYGFIRAAAQDITET